MPGSPDWWDTGEGRQKIKIQEKKAGDGVGDSEQLVLRKHLLGGSFGVTWPTWQGVRAVLGGSREGKNRSRDVVGIKRDVSQFTFRSVGLRSSKSRQGEGLVGF